MPVSDLVSNGRFRDAPKKIVVGSALERYGLRHDRSYNAVGYAKFYSRSHDALIRVYDAAGNMIDTHEHAGEFKEW